MELIAICLIFIFGVFVGRLMRNEEKDLRVTEVQNRNARLLIENDRLKDELQQSEDALVESLRRQVSFELEAA